MENNDLYIYLKEMWHIKKRMEAIQTVATNKNSTLFQYTNIEFIMLQIRKVIEHIAMGNLVVNKDLYSKYNDKFSSNWNVKYIFKDLERLNPQFYPVPVKTDDTVKPKKWVDVDKEMYLTKQEAIKVYNKCISLMHVSNPYGSQIDIYYYQKMIPIWYTKIMNLLNQHIIHMADREQLYCIVMNGDEDGNPHGYVFMPANQ